VGPPLRHHEQVSSHHRRESIFLYETLSPLPLFGLRAFGVDYWPERDHQPVADLPPQADKLRPEAENDFKRFERGGSLRLGTCRGQVLLPYRRGRHRSQGDRPSI
jgi:hypothetical protein